MHSSLHVSSQTHKWQKHYPEKLEALHLISYLIYIIFHFIVLLHLKYYNSWVKWNFFMFFFKSCTFIVQCNNMETCISLGFFGFVLVSQITYFISSYTLIMLYLFSFYLSVNLNSLSYEVQHIVLHLHNISFR